LPQRVNQNGRFRVVSQDGGNCRSHRGERKGKTTHCHCHCVCVCQKILFSLSYY
jgi:hypothetical protein